MHVEKSTLSTTRLEQGRLHCQGVAKQFIYLSVWLDPFSCKAVFLSECILRANLKSCRFMQHLSDVKVLGLGTRAGFSCKYMRLWEICLGHRHSAINEIRQHVIHIAPFIFLVHPDYKNVRFGLFWEYIIYCPQSRLPVTERAFLKWIYILFIL